MKNRKKDSLVDERMCDPAEILKLPVHPAADRYPMMDLDSQLALGADMQRSGQLHAVVVSDGVLLDGRNRVYAAKLMGVKVRVEFHAGLSDDEIQTKIYSTGDRRHLSPRKRAIMAVAYYDAERAAGYKVTQEVAAWRYDAGVSTVKRLIAARKEKAKPKKRSERVTIEQIPRQYRPMVRGLCELHRLNGLSESKARRRQLTDSLTWCLQELAQFDELHPSALLLTSNHWKSPDATGD
jgi:hypothetical protein